jgi:hypothetical protein
LPSLATVYCRVSQHQATADNGRPILSDDLYLVQRIRYLCVRGANSWKQST